jgi:hypothetical protein
MTGSAWPLAEWGATRRLTKGIRDKRNEISVGNKRSTNVTNVRFTLEAEDGPLPLITPFRSHSSTLILVVVICQTQPQGAAEEGRGAGRIQYVGGFHLSQIMRLLNMALHSVLNTVRSMAVSMAAVSSFPLDLRRTPLLPSQAVSMAAVSSFPLDLRRTPLLPSQAVSI